MGHFGSAKSLPTATSIMLTNVIDEEKEQISKRHTYHIKSPKSTKSPNRDPGLSRSGSISSRSSSFGFDSHTPKISNRISYEEKAPITKIAEFTKIKNLHSALRQCMYYIFMLVYSVYSSELIFMIHRSFDIVTSIDFNPKYMIKDDIEEIIDIIKITTHFIKPFVNRDGMPFQVYCVCIVYYTLNYFIF